jgi:hypothetical protein
MDGLNLCWRGQPGSGKRTELHKALQQVANLRGIPFHIQNRQFHMQASKSDTGQISTTVEDEGGDEGGSEKDSFPYEFSFLHIGFDIARMSMQDKIYLKPILQRWSSGSQVLAGQQGRGSRILVFYHAHLFSTESYFLLHSLLEKNFGDVSLWFTSELPVAERLRDYFIEVPVVQKLDFYTSAKPSWHRIFYKILYQWSNKSKPKLSETNEVRAFLYELLMRNLRWTDCVHYLMDVIFVLPLSFEKKAKLFAILANQEATAAGETIPSYRIPLLWENLFLEIRKAISKDEIDGSVDFKNDGRGSSEPLQSTTSALVARETKPRRYKSTKGGSTGTK